jgi:Nif-specific regulatory protein
MSIAVQHRRIDWDAFARIAESQRLRLAGRPNEAKQIFSPVRDRVRTAELHGFTRLNLLAEIARASIAERCHASARLVLDEMEATAREHRGLLSESAIARIRALLVNTMGDDVDPRDTYEPAIEKCAEAGLALDRWLTLAEFGDHLWRRAQILSSAVLQRHAVATLTRARDGLAAVGADTTLVDHTLMDIKASPLALGRNDDSIDSDLIGHMLTVLGSVSDPDRLMARGLDLVAEVVGGERAVIVMRDGVTGRLQVTATRGVPSRSQLRALSVSRSVIREAMRSRDAVISIDVESDERMRCRNSIRRLGIRGVICLPLMVGNQVVGALYADRLEERGPRRERISSTLTRVASCIAQAIRQAQAQERMKDESNQLRSHGIRLARRSGAVIDGNELIGSSPAMQQLRLAIDRAAACDSCTLIVGESGTGKRRAARSIHDRSLHHNEPFVPISPSDIAEGRLSRIKAGALLLANVMELDAKLQIALVEQSRKRSGGTERGGAPLDQGGCRLLLTTSCDPAAAVRSGRLTTNLYDCFASSIIHVPALRERSSDIPQLVVYFLRCWSSERGCVTPTAPAEFLGACMSDSWCSTNVRGLREVVSAAAESGDYVPGWMSAYEIHATQRNAESGFSSVSDSFENRVRAFERQEITRALQTVGWSQAAAARLLDLPEPTLRRKVKSLGIREPE